jgi:cysteine-rich repeat protein
VTCIETCTGTLTACLTGCEPEAATVCGNNTVESGEVCDDGNTVFGDGCSANCLSNETCGNGYIDTAIGEGCDDGNTVSGDGCSANCQLEYSPPYLCFLEGTEISMADGSSKNIEDINIGDRVLSFSEDKLTTESASKVFSSLTDYYYILKTENYEVNVTGEHPFYTGEGFRTVKELLVGDKIYVLEDGELIPEKIIHKELVKKQAKIYNLTIKGTQTYFANGFAVHNKLPWDFEP